MTAIPPIMTAVHPPARQNAAAMEVKQSNEACDDGNTSNTDGCTNACTLPVCGDGFINQTSEVCDDGNTANNDGCSSTCQTERCGDGVKQSNEACDDGNTSNTDGCTNACTLQSAAMALSTKPARFAMTAIPPIMTAVHPPARQNAAAME